VHCDLLERAADGDKICKFVVDLMTRCHEEDNFCNAKCTKLIEACLSMSLKLELDASV
jgi:hypothetical protein